MHIYSICFPSYTRKLCDICGQACYLRVHCMHIRLTTIASPMQYSWARFVSRSCGAQLNATRSERGNRAHRQRIRHGMFHKINTAGQNGCASRIYAAKRARNAKLFAVNRAADNISSTRQFAQNFIYIYIYRFFFLVIRRREYSIY